MIDPSRAARQILTRLTPCLAFIAWVASLCWLLAGGRYTSFLLPSLWVLLVGAIVTMLAFVVARVGRAALPVRHDHGEDESGDAGAGDGPAHEDGPAHGEPALRTVLLLLPLAFLFAKPAPEAGSYAFDNRSGMGTGRWRVQLPAEPTSDPAAATEPDPPASPRPAVTTDATLLEIYNSFAPLANRRVVTIGMINPRAGLPGDTVVVFRFTLVCCAADAKPVWILATGPGARSFKRDTWVRVEGVLGTCQIDGRPVPWIKADRIDPIRRPFDAYLN